MEWTVKSSFSYAAAFRDGLGLLAFRQHTAAPSSSWFKNHLAFREPLLAALLPLPAQAGIGLPPTAACHASGTLNASVGSTALLGFIIISATVSTVKSPLGLQARLYVSPSICIPFLQILELDELYTVIGPVIQVDAAQLRAGAVS